MNQLLISDAASWIINNRGNSFAFRAWTHLELCRAIQRAIELKSFCWSVNESNQLTGVCIAIPSHELKRLHIVGILLVAPKLIRNYIKTVKERFPGYIVLGYRKQSTKKCFDFTSKLNLLERL